MTEIEKKFDDSINKMDEINTRLTFFRDLINIETQSDEFSSANDEYSFGKSLLISDMQNELMHVKDIISEISKSYKRK